MPDIQNNLYPPIINHAVMPAFIYNQTCKVYFSISNFNKLSSESSDNSDTVINQNLVQVTVQRQSNNQNVLNSQHYPNGIKITSLMLDTDINQYYIQISNSDIQNGFNLNQYYKVQIRFTEAGISSPGYLQSGISEWLNENLEHFSEWSTVALIYGISQPTLILKNFTKNQTNTFNSNNIIVLGALSFSNSSDKEKLQSYRVLLYDVYSGQLLQDSGNIYTNNSNNPNEINYTIKYNLIRQHGYNLKIQFLTNNGYADSNSNYIFSINAASAFPTIGYNVSVNVNDSTGCIKIIIDNRGNNIPQGTKLKFLRTSSAENFRARRQIATIQTTQTNKKIIWSDYSVQPGVWYNYQIVQYNTQNEEIASLTLENNYMINPEDIFLISNDRQLKIRFDPQISNYTIKRSESITETIGSKYPFINRNGNMNYTTFSLSGTISYFSDIEQNLFKASKQDLFGNSKSLYQEYNENNNIGIYNDYILEREFRKKVIDFLYQNNVKLFRSLTEGNLIVKLTNIALTPNNTLGRMIYSFSCDVNQIDENTYDNYKKYNLLLSNMIQIKN